MNGQSQKWMQFWRPEEKKWGKRHTYHKIEFDIFERVTGILNREKQ